MGTEIRIAQGETIEILEADINKIASVRDIEIDRDIRQGYEVVATKDQWFEPCGPISFENGCYFMPMKRKMGY